MAGGGEQAALRAIYSGNSRPSPRRLMEAPVVWDTDVLVCFAQINRTQLIRDGFSDRSHVPGAVDGELRGLQNKYATITTLRQPTHFATVHTMTRSEAGAAAELQRAWVGKQNWLNDPKWHRGEAECIQLAKRKELGGMTFPVGPRAPMVTHDGGARRSSIGHGIYVFTCIEVLAVLAACGQLLPESAWDRWLDMSQRPVNYRSRDWGVTPDDRARFLELVELLRAGPESGDPAG